MLLNAVAESNSREVIAQIPSGGVTVGNVRMFKGV